MSDRSISEAVHYPVGMPDSGDRVKGVACGLTDSTCKRVPHVVYAAVKTTVPSGMRISTVNGAVNASPASSTATDWRTVTVRAMVVAESESMSC